MPSLFIMGKAQIGFVCFSEKLGFLACITLILAMKVYAIVKTVCNYELAVES